MSNKNDCTKDLKAYLNSLNDGDNITVTCDLLDAMADALNYITELQSKHDNVYMVKYEWSTDDDQGIDVELFKNYKDAVKRFNKIIENEKDPDISWASNAFDGDEFDDENYELDYRSTIKKSSMPNYSDYMYWSISRRDDGNFYSTVILTKEQVQ